MIKDWFSCTGAEPGTRMARLILTINELMLSGLDACITGSSIAVIESNFADVEDWSSVPDVDVFCYSEATQAAMIQYVKYQMRGKPGKGDEVTRKQEEWKVERILRGKQSKDSPISSVTLTTRDNVKVNVTLKKNCTSLARVIESFDMSIVMVGIDIKTGVMLDLRGDPRVATPNKLRQFDTSLWNVAHWTRQFDRVLKYYSRGFDTRPMARFYLDAIDECLAQGKMFTSEKYLKMYDEFTTEFTQTRARISEWLGEHDDD